MKRLAIVLLLMAPVTSGVVSAEDWPGWRGPRGDGTSTGSAPTRWDGVSGDNIAWRVPVRGVGHSSPVVHGERVFLATCLEGSLSRQLVCFDRRDGTERWRRTVFDAPLEKKHRLNSFASGTPVTDGRHVYVSFLEPDEGGGSGATPGDLVVAAYDIDGDPRWEARPGRFSSVHGFCSSPVIYENLLIINGDHDGDSYLAALDRRTGETVWKVPRRHRTRSYVTPIIRELDGRVQMVLSGSKSVVSYDPRDGREHWRMDGPTEQFVASLVDDGRYLFLTAGFPDHHILAIRPDGRGDVTESQIVWRTTRGCSYVPSPVVVSPYLIVAADNGIVSCFDASTGARHWMTRLGSHYSASLVTAGGLVYLLDDDGRMKVVRPGSGSEPEVVADNALGEPCYASPAIAGGQLFIRGERHLYAIGKPTRR